MLAEIWHDARTAHPPDAESDRSNGRVFRIAYRLAVRLHRPRPREQRLGKAVSASERLAPLQGRRIWPLPRCQGHPARRTLAAESANDELVLRAPAGLYVSDGFDRNDFGAMLLDCILTGSRRWTCDFWRRSPGRIGNRASACGARFESRLVEPAACTARRLPLV